MCSCMLDASEDRTARHAATARYARADLDGIMGMLGPDELAVLRWVAVKLLAGGIAEMRQVLAKGT